MKSRISIISTFLRRHTQPLLTSVLLFVLLLLLFALSSLLPVPVIGETPPGVTVVNYNIFVGQVKAYNMLQVTMQGDDLTGELAHPLYGQTCIAPQTDTEKNPFDFTPPSLINACAIYTQLPARGDPALLSLLHRNGVMINTLPAPSSSTTQINLWRFTPILLLLLFVIFVLKLYSRKGPLTLHMNDESFSRFMKGSVKRLGHPSENDKPRNKMARPALSTQPAREPAPLVPSRPSVTFADVAGIDEVRAELEEVVQFLRCPDQFDRLGAYLPHGILLIGPPGTGKTLLAKAVAGEASVPFFSMSASEFIEIFVGVGASRVRALFQQARQSAPCVIFLDELDAVGRKRSTHALDHSERDQTLNQLLIELDGFGDRKAIVVLAATNRIDMLDKALLRPGRFDRHIVVSLPDRVGREAILRVHTRHTPLHEEVHLDDLARQTTGMSGADLANLVNEAALCAARRGLDSITQACFEEALVRVQLGAQRPLVMNEADRRIIAFHEGGHSLVAHYLPAADKVNRITILPHGQRLGATQFIAAEDHYNYSRETLMARIAVGLGGRVAEELTFGPEGVTTGAENDLQLVTALAWRMVTHWGMGKRLGTIFADYCEPGNSGLNSHTHVVSVQPHQSMFDTDHSLLLNRDNRSLPQHALAMTMPSARYISSATMATLIDHEVQDILNDGRATAYRLLSEHYNQLIRLAQALMEHEQLNRTQFEALLESDTSEVGTL
jgi:ATP-dependent metalloprotease FtsH